MKKLYVFDLDGVLIDSLPNMEMSWGVVKLHHNIDVPFSEYAKHIGKPFYDILTEIGIHEDQERIKLTYDEASIQGTEIKIYPGVIETLEELKSKGCKIAICTSKDIKRVHHVIASLILDGKKMPKFDWVCAPKQGLRGKPAPDQLLNTIAFCNEDPHDTYYIGDMESDMFCANRAGVDFIHANYGYGQVKCELSVNQIEQILSL
jgi:phosphoglycolate phosphatase-like HAD superfamily hydrolase|tara:strand:- start:5433 stop:6047 length:615 start_codon:yes stop_codon:yes gene_type:complete